MSGPSAVHAWRYARRRGARLLLYIWDLPPGGSGHGRPDPVWWIAGRFLRIPRLWGGYRRGGYFSRLRYIALRADAVWVPSAMTHEIVADRFGVRAQRVPYCYDSDRFVPADAGARAIVRAALPTLLTVSRLRRHKNQAAVLHAATLLDRDVRVRLVGRGPQQENLEALAARLGVPCTVETAADDWMVARAYHEAAVVVCPSRFEGFGLTPVEAVASGVPVVASDIPPHRELVGRAARFAPPDDAAAMARVIDEALDSAPADPRLVADLTIPAAAARFFGSLQNLLG
jgi:glycosyltransferase involved in cell wall biosynthesis